MNKLVASRPALAAGDLVKHGTDATFKADVIDASMTIPILVDFWAVWCGPCKTLGPMLEDAVHAAGGVVKMVKVDVDQNQQIAAQLRIQSIPAVYAFWQGQPVDAFHGALPQPEIKTFVDRLIELAGNDGARGGLDEVLAAADDLLEQGAAVDAAQTYVAILGEEPENAKALAGLARASLALGEVGAAADILAKASEAFFDAPELEAVGAQIDLARSAQSAGPIDELNAKLAQDANDHQTWLSLAAMLNADGQTQAAVDALSKAVQSQDKPNWFSDKTVSVKWPIEDLEAHEEAVKGMLAEVGTEAKRIRQELDASNVRVMNIINEIESRN